MKKPLLRPYTQICEDMAVSNLDNTPGIGAITSAQPGYNPGDYGSPGTVGAGDMLTKFRNVSFQNANGYVLGKWKEKKKKSDQSTAEK